MSRRSPIIVVGKNRSGTKWLSNLLANHSRVAAVQSELHNGVLETNFFGVMQETFGDVRRVENYIAMVEAWAHTDFFKASGCDKTLLYTSRPRPRSYAEVFDLIMEDMARREGASHWLQKTSPLQAESVVDSFPRCRVVVITRELIPTLESSITLARTLGTDASAARATFRFVLEQRLLDRITASRPVVMATYEELKADSEAVLRRVCGQLELEFERSMLQLSWRPNSSFDSRARARDSLSRRELRTIGVVSRALSVVPTGGLTWLRERIRSRGSLFVRGTYRAIAERYDLE